MSLRVADNPKASRAQIARLAKKDLAAALIHPNAPLELLLDHPEHYPLIARQNPAWVLHTLSNPFETRRLYLLYEQGALKEALDRLCLPRTLEDRKRIVTAILEGLQRYVEPGVKFEAGRVNSFWDTRLQRARREILRWVLGLPVGGFADRWASDAARDANAVAAKNPSKTERLRFADAHVQLAAVCGAVNDANSLSLPQGFGVSSKEFKHHVFKIFRAKSEHDIEEQVQEWARVLAIMEKHLAGKVAWVERALRRQR